MSLFAVRFRNALKSILAILILCFFFNLAINSLYKNIGILDNPEILSRGHSDTYTILIILFDWLPFEIAALLSGQTKEPGVSLLIMNSLLMTIFWVILLLPFIFQNKRPGEKNQMKILTGKAMVCILVYAVQVYIAYFLYSAYRF